MFVITGASVCDGTGSLLQTCCKRSYIPSFGISQEIPLLHEREQLSVVLNRQQYCLVLGDDKPSRHAM